MEDSTDGSVQLEKDALTLRQEYLFRKTNIGIAKQSQRLYKSGQIKWSRQKLNSQIREDWEHLRTVFQERTFGHLRQSERLLGALCTHQDLLVTEDSLPCKWAARKSTPQNGEHTSIIKPGYCDDHTDDHEFCRGQQLLASERLDARLAYGSSHDVPLELLSNFGQNEAIERYNWNLISRICVAANEGDSDETSSSDSDSGSETPTFMPSGSHQALQIGNIVARPIKSSFVSFGVQPGCSTLNFSLYKSHKSREFIPSKEDDSQDLTKPSYSPMRGTNLAQNESKREDIVCETSEACTLATIAHKFRVSTKDILNWNGTILKVAGCDDNLLLPGQFLNLSVRSDVLAVFSREILQYNNSPIHFKKVHSGSGKYSRY